MVTPYARASAQADQHEVAGQVQPQALGAVALQPGVWRDARAPNGDIACGRVESQLHALAAGIERTPRALGPYRYRSPQSQHARAIPARQQQLLDLGRRVCL